MCRSTNERQSFITSMSKLSRIFKKKGGYLFERSNDKNRSKRNVIEEKNEFWFQSEELKIKIRKELFSGLHSENSTVSLSVDRTESKHRLDGFSASKGTQKSQHGRGYFVAHSHLNTSQASQAPSNGVNRETAGWQDPFNFRFSLPEIPRFFPILSTLYFLCYFNWRQVAMVS